MSWAYTVFDLEEELWASGARASIIITFHISAFPQDLHIDFYLMRLLMAHVGARL